MKKLLLGLALAGLPALLASPASAALKVGDAAPDFSAQGSLGGQDFSFNLKAALKKGPVVVYFYPSAYTKGCDIEAHTFAEQKDKFDAAGASIVGVSGDSVARLKDFADDPNYCAGKFPVVSDSDGKTAAAYNLHMSEAKAGATDVRGVEIGHGFIERVTYVIGKDGKIAATLSSNDDHLTPDAHVDKSLAMVQQLAAK